MIQIVIDGEVLFMFVFKYHNNNGTYFIILTYLMILS